MNDLQMSRRNFLGGAATGAILTVAGCAGLTDTFQRPEIQSVELQIERPSGEYHDLSLVVRFSESTSEAQLTPEYLKTLFVAPGDATLSIPDVAVFEASGIPGAVISFDQFTRTASASPAIATSVPNAPLTAINIPEIIATPTANWSDNVDVLVRYLETDERSFDLRTPRIFGGECKGSRENCYLQYIDNGVTQFSGDSAERLHLDKNDYGEFIPPQSRETFTTQAPFADGTPEFQYLAGETFTTLDRLARRKNTLATEARLLFDPKRYLGELEAEVVEKIKQTLVMVADAAVSTPVSTSTPATSVVSLAGASARSLLTLRSSNQLADTEQLERAFENAIGLSVNNPQLLLYLVRRSAYNVEGAAEEYNKYYDDKSPSLGQIEFLSVMEFVDFLPLIRTAQTPPERLELLLSYHNCLDEELGVIRALSHFISNYEPNGVNGQKLLALRLKEYGLTILDYLEAYTEVGYAWSWHALDITGDAPEDLREVITDST